MQTIEFIETKVEFGKFTTFLGIITKDYSKLNKLYVKYFTKNKLEQRKDLKWQTTQTVNNNYIDILKLKVKNIMFLKLPRIN